MTPPADRSRSDQLGDRADPPFGLAALPYGVFSTRGAPRVGVRFGDAVLDLAAVADSLAEPLTALFDRPDLNAFLAAGPATWATVREQLTDWLTAGRYQATVRRHLLPLPDVELRLPVAIGDYVDFYSNRHHAENLGALLRPGSPALTPNWLHLPIGYHGRAGTIVVTGTEVIRPYGQFRTAPEAEPVFGPSQRLDFEAEVGFVVGVPSRRGEPVPVSAIAEHVFGVVLVNDWSARDVQAWEYAPLGPFLGKSFATTISAWVLPLAALEHARVPPPARAQPLQPYLRDADPWGLDIELRVALNGTPISAPPFATTYWTPAQQLAHLTVNGTPLRTGDLFASGTVSGPEPHQRGSLIELSWNGQRPVPLPDGSSRSFLADGDRVTISASAPGPAGCRVPLGEVSGRILPARPAHSWVSTRS